MRMRADNRREKGGKIALLAEYRNQQIYHNHITTIPFGAFDFVLYYAEQMSQIIPVFEHQHDLYEIFYGIEGEANVVCGQDSLPLYENSMVLLGKNHLHRLRYMPEKPAVYFTMIFDIIPKSGNSSIDAELEYREIAKALDKADTNKYIYLPRAVSQQALLADIHKQIQDRKIGWASQIGILYYLFVLNLLRQTTSVVSDVKTPLGYKNIALEASKYIHSNYADELTIDMVAQQLNVTPRHVNRLFQEMFGRSFAHTVSVTRMEYAKKYLRTTNDSLERIAMHVGLPSGKVLIRLFHEQEGMSPGDYRAKFH